jgi:phenylacetate-CoA ligase
MATICVWGSQRDIGKAQESGRGLSAYMANAHIVDGYSLTDETVDAVLALIRKHHHVAVYGFTSMLEFVARRVIERNQRPPSGSVRAAWNGGEMLFDNQKELFQDAFGTPLLNLYGGRELSAMAYQAAGTDFLKIVRPYLFAEIVDESGKMVEPGQTGRVVWTSTVCRGTPFLRYDIGDVGCYSSDLRDDSGLIGIRELQGRVAGLLTLPNGKTVNCIYWNHLIKEYPEVEQFQIVLRSGSSLEIRLKGSGFAKEREAELRKLLLDFLGEVPVEISWLDRIPLTSQGKLVQVIREDN